MIRAPVEVGSAANRYEILAKLAMGGMAEIFLARGASAAGLERYVVLKRVLGDRARDDVFVQMFLDEARLAAQLQHPNVAQVYDIGTLGDSYFFTMEYVHGETVRNLLARSHGLQQPVPIPVVLSIIAGAAAGLHHAHERKGTDGRHLGIVHRDVSPANLIVSYEGTVKVVDFGVAKAAHRTTETQVGIVKGKLSYMSPEQGRGGEVDRRSDLFSLGIVMWELLTSDKLFRRDSDFETLQAIVRAEVTPPSRLRAGLAPEIEHVVMRLLAKDPAQRYQTADELHEAIETVAVRTGSALSTASLGRYMREVFGQKPEPWLELGALEQHPEIITITSEPLLDDDSMELAVVSAPALPPYPVATSTPAALTAYPVVARPPEYSGRHPTRSRHVRAAIIMLPALAVGIALGTVLALGGGSGDEARPIAAASVVPSTTKTMIATPEPALPSAPPPAPPSTPPPSTAPAPTVVHVESAPSIVETQLVEPIAPKPRVDVATLFKTGSYAEVVSECAESPRLVARYASACTVAACKVKQAARAKRWFSSVGPARQPSVIADCAGVIPDPPNDDEICIRDPLACRQ